MAYWSWEKLTVLIVLTAATAEVMVNPQSDIDQPVTKEDEEAWMNPVKLDIDNLKQPASRVKRQTCSSYSDTDYSKCKPCGGCGVATRTCLDNSVVEPTNCKPDYCVYGTHPIRESVRSRKGRWVRRERRCCYDFRPCGGSSSCTEALARRLSREKRCLAKRVKGYRRATVL